MTAVTFPLRPPRLAFAVCGKRWQNDECKNNLYRKLKLTYNAIVYQVFPWQIFSLEISLQDIFFSEFSHTPFEKSNKRVVKG